MVIGFSGTRNFENDFDLIKALKGEVYSLVSGGVYEFHHGDCVGADYFFHFFIYSFCNLLNQKSKIVIHPPTSNALRAFCDNAHPVSDMVEVIVLPCKPYLKRNEDIVESCDLLIACPESAVEVQRSGTWATIRRARSAGKEVKILTLPNIRAC